MPGDCDCKCPKCEKARDKGWEIRGHCDRPRNGCRVTVVEGEPE